MAVVSKTRVHNWVKHIVVPVEVVPDFSDDDAIMAVVDPDKQKIAEENGVFGCQDCGALLTFETSTTECPGEDNE